MKQKLKGLYLNGQDIGLFHYLHAVKVATYDQIARDIYPEYSFTSVGNRLRKLEDNRLVTAERVRILLGSKRTVHLAKKAFETYVKKGGEYVVELKSDAVLHDLTLVDLRAKFLKSPKTVLYQTENQIQTWSSEKRKFNCDAIITSNLGKATFEIPLEYESSMKKADRYDALIKKYYQTEFPLVAYISDSQVILDKVKESEEKLFNWDKPKFFYRLATDFLNDETMRLENCHKMSLSLGC